MRPSLLAKGEVVTLLCPNGARKTTTIKLIASVLDSAALEAPPC